jgi:hypothetical protein
MSNFAAAFCRRASDQVSEVGEQRGVSSQGHGQLVRAIGDVHHCRRSAEPTPDRF